MKITDIIPEADILVALEPDELGIRLLPFLGPMGRRGELQLSVLLDTILGRTDVPANSTLAFNHYPPQHRADIDEALREAWAWLEGTGLLVPSPRYTHSIKILSRRARTLAASASPQNVWAARRIPKDSLHQSIREEVWALYHREEFELAIIQAMKAVEVSVRQAGGFGNGDIGKDMIARAFNSDRGPLRDQSALPAEREALFALITGAFALYRNPYVHRHIGQNDPDEAAEIIMLANHLLRIVDTRVAALVTAGSP